MDLIEQQIEWARRHGGLNPLPGWNPPTEYNGPPDDSVRLKKRPSKRKENVESKVETKAEPEPNVIAISSAKFAGASLKHSKDFGGLMDIKIKAQFDTVLADALQVTDLIYYQDQKANAWGLTWNEIGPTVTIRPAQQNLFQRDGYNLPCNYLERMKVVREENDNMVIVFHVFVTDKDHAAHLLAHDVMLTIGDALFTVFIEPKAHEASEPGGNEDEDQLTIGDDDIQV